MGLTTDPDSDCLGRGVDEAPVPQNACYLVLSAEERVRGFVRPLRDSYLHVGPPGPRFPTRPLTADEEARFNAGNDERYVAFEPYPDDFKLNGSSTVGRFWTQKQLDAAGKGCRAVTTMGRALAETYARQPNFYGATYCVGCRMHRPVGERGEFFWDGTVERVGT